MNIGQTRFSIETFNEQPENSRQFLKAASRFFQLV